MMNFLKAIVIVFGGIFVLLVIAAMMVEPDKKKPAQTKPEQRVCDAKQAGKLVNDMIHKTHVFKHIKPGVTVPKITVEPVWYHLDFDQKKAVDNGILCWLADGYPAKVPNVQYLDAFTGKVVASSGPRGFSME